MVETRQDNPRLSGDELRDLLGLIEGADTVELKLTVPESDRHSALTTLDVDPLESPRFARCSFSTLRT